MNADVVIVGGGLAGSTAAILLARSGRNVVLVEKESQPQHKVCGEFLSQEALTYLNTLGLDAASLGAVPIHSVRIAGITQPLPFAAMSLTRRRLDEELLHLAAQAGATVLRGSRVRAIDHQDTAWTATLDDARTLTAPDLFLATGKHDLSARPRPSGKQSNMVGFKMYFRLSPQQAAALNGHVELLLYRGGYAGLQPVENGLANLCCLIHRSRLQQLAEASAEGHWPALLAAMQHDCKHLRERLRDAVPALERPLAISSIPYGFVRRATQPNLWALGDQAAVIPSFTGDGMSIALHSGVTAATAYLRGDTAESFQHCLHHDLANQVSLATVLSRGLVWSPSRSIFAAVVHLRPSLLAAVARRTRIAPHSLDFLPAASRRDSILSS